MRLLMISMTIGLVVFLGACGSQPSGLELKFGDEQKTFDSKHSYTYHTTKTFAFTKDGKTERTSGSITRIFLTSYKLDVSQGMISIGKQKISKPEDLKVVIAFTGARESSGKEAIKTGKYLPENERFEDIEGVRIHSFDGKGEKRTVFKLSSLKGFLNIDSVDEKTVTGTVDLTDGENSIKGSFTADAPRPR